MAQMRYYTIDLLTNNVISELPLFGVYMDKMLSAAGNFTGTYQLDTGVESDAFLLAGTIPGQHAIFVERNNTVIWAGPIWVRTYQSTSRSIQLQAQTYESVFEHIPMTSDQIYGAVEQNTIMSSFLSAIASQTNNNFGFTYSGPGATGIARSLSYPAAEYHMASELLDALSQAANGLDYTINVASPTSKTFVATYAAATPADSGLVYDYPGAIANYWYAESAQKGAVSAVAIGNGAVATGNLGAQGASMPYFWQVLNLNDIADSALLQQKVNKALGMPAISPTFELSSSGDFGGWDKCGQTFRVFVQDPRFRTMNQISARMMGWAFTPEQSDTDENIKFVLETDT